MSQLAEKLVDLGENLNSDELLYFVEGQLIAGKKLEGALPDGLIRAIDYRRQGDEADGLGIYNPGTDKAQDLDVRATFSTGIPTAQKKRGQDQARNLYLLTETGERFRGSTGYRTLATLSRLTVAVTCVVADKTNARMHTIVGEKGKKPLVVDEQPSDSIITMRSYDGFASAKPEVSKRTPEFNNQSILANGLKYLSDYGPNEDTDVALVVSDFTQGASRSRKGRLLGFDWEQDLQNLALQLEDRLFVVRLASPAQTMPALAATMQINGKESTLSPADFQRFSEHYQELGLEKAGRIADVLQHIRHVELDSTDRASLIALTDFVFGKPAEN